MVEDTWLATRECQPLFFVLVILQLLIMPQYSYSYQVIANTSILLEYLQKSIPSISSIVNDGTALQIVSSQALTAEEQVLLTDLVSAFVDPVTGQVDALNISLYNSTKVVLSANGVYTGTWEDVSRYSSFIVSAISDVDSAADGLQVQVGFRDEQADMVQTFTITGNASVSYTVSIPGRHVRVVYTNGSTAQTSFALQAIRSVSQICTVVTSKDVITDDLSAQLCMSMMVGKQGTTYKSLQLDSDDCLKVTSSNEASAGVAIVQVSYIYSINATVNTTQIVGSGSVGATSGQAVLSTGAASGSSATLSTRRFAHCPSGQKMTAMIACAFHTPTTGSTQIVGIGSTSNGLYLGFNGTSFGALIRSDGVNVWTAQSLFNVDKLDGTSSLLVDFTKGNTYVITYDATGYGGATFSIVSPVTREVVTVHKVSFGNKTSGIGIRNPTGPLTARVSNESVASTVALKIASFAAFLHTQSSSVGPLWGADATRYIKSLSYTPIVTVYNKLQYSSQTNMSSVQIDTINVASDGTKGTVIIALYDSPVLTGANFTDVDASASVIQIDKSATAFSDGTLLHAIPVNISNNATIKLSKYNLHVSPGNSLLIAAKSTSNGCTSLISIGIQWISEY